MSIIQPHSTGYCVRKPAQAALCQAKHWGVAVSKASIVALIFAISLMSAGLGEGARAAKVPPVAPQWDISQWFNTKGLKLSDLRGQVVVIDFFQMWCPGCNKFSLPLMARWEKLFAREIREKKLTILSIHTVFEGHKQQTVKRLHKYIIKKAITHPVGVDRHEGTNRLPNTMIRYKTNGTPEMAFIDKKGRIRFQKFGYFDPYTGEGLIRALLAE